MKDIFPEEENARPEFENDPESRTVAAPMALLMAAQNPVLAERMADQITNNIKDSAGHLAALAAFGGFSVFRSGTAMLENGNQAVLGYAAITLDCSALEERGLDPVAIKNEIHEAFEALNNYFESLKNME